MTCGINKFVFAVDLNQCRQEQRGNCVSADIHNETRLCPVG